MNTSSAASSRTHLVGVGALCLLAALSGCAINNPYATSAPSPGASSAASTSLPTAGAGTPTIPGATSTPSPSSASTASDPSVDAAGSLTLYLRVSKALKGTCSTVLGTPTLLLVDPSNEFFADVTVTVRLAPDKGSVTWMETMLGEDSEGNAWRMNYDATNPANGSSATLVTKGRQYTVSGKAMLGVQDAGSGELSPYTITATCESGQW